MANKMLIDATHAEETRVVVVKGQRVEEFDLESQERRQLRGNIYLAKVTRVEPSLQAAFVEYGGNRHGFLAFSEIHPDYYQIPFSDRQELLKEAAEAAREDADGDGETKPSRKSRAKSKAKREAERDAEAEAGDGDEAEAEAGDDEAADGEVAGADARGASDEEASEAGSDSDGGEDGNEAGAADNSADSADNSADAVDGGDAVDVTDSIDGGESEDGAQTEAAEASGEETGEGGDGDESGSRSSRGRRPRRRRRSVAEKADVPVLREAAPEDGASDEIEQVGAEDALEEVPDRAVNYRRQYKIQEVIRRRQILLVQVVKEERGTKGAALTTYLSLAGRYCVLMPNTARGGGISRKITSPADRKRLKAIAGDLKVPEGAGVIVRTAGANRTKAEIKRDYEYLQRLWETVRNLTLKSTAPSLIYEEGNLIKRSIRDLYNKDIDEVLVEGEEGYKESKAFMRMLMPSHARHVKQYKDDQPLFVRHRIESQLDQMFSPVVTLKSGGYLVINQTEALVAIDVNSGKSTREHNIEDTAYQTNMEAAAEVARQLRLRDLAGLIVIDFIDMEERRNNRSVERKIKECLKTDRARIQVGRISHFGLLEMSRQRIRASVIEGTMETCHHCQGSGRVRAVGSTALQILRSLEEAVAQGKQHHLNITTNAEIALYMLNRKRSHIREIEERYGIHITISIDETTSGSNYTIERGAVADAAPARASERAVQIDTAFEDDDADGTESSAASQGEASQRDEQRDGDGQPRRKRRRRGRRRGEDGEASEAGGDTSEADEAGEAALEAGEATSDAADTANGEDGAEGADDGEDGRGRSRRRRGRRGGRRNRREDGNGNGNGEAASGMTAPEDASSGEVAASEEAASEEPRAQGEESRNGVAQAAIAWPWRSGGGGKTDAEAGAGTSSDSDADVAGPEQVEPVEAVEQAEAEASADVEQDAQAGAVAASGFEGAGTEQAGAEDTGAGDTGAGEAGTGDLAVPDPAPDETDGSANGNGAVAGASAGAGGEEDTGDDPTPPSSTPDPNQPQKRGWWQRRFAS